MLDGYGFLDGDYQISTEVDGKPSWINNDYAIWYKSIHNSWFIGDSNDIGQSLCYFYAYNDFSDPTADDNQWFYWNGNSWTSPSNPEDISIDAFMINDTLNPFLNMSTFTEQKNGIVGTHPTTFLVNSICTTMLMVKRSNWKVMKFGQKYFMTTMDFATL